MLFFLLFPFIMFTFLGGLALGGFTSLPKNHLLILIIFIENYKKYKVDKTLKLSPPKGHSITPVSPSLFVPPTFEPILSSTSIHLATIIDLVIVPSLEPIVVDPNPSSLYQKTS